MNNYVTETQAELVLALEKIASKEEIAEMTKRNQQEMESQQAKFN